MPAIDTLFGQPLAEALGWALLHSVWQIALVAAIAAAVLALARRGAADVRYVVSSIALALMLTWPAVTAWTTWATLTAEPVSRAAYVTASMAPAPAAGTAVSVDAPPARLAPWSPATETTSAPPDLGRWLPLVLTVWLGGVTLFSLRLLMGWVLVERLRLAARRPVGAAVQRMVARVSRRLHVAGPVAAFESAAVDVPAVIGWLKPVLLVPASALGGLSPDQLEAILAHEIAHVRRHDYLVNLLQTVVETLLFYHPAVWWVSRRIRIEREHCCDDLAAALCGDPVRYARALADLEGLRVRSGGFALAATDGSLLGRVRRLLGGAPRSDRSPAWLTVVPALVMVAAGAAGATAITGQTSATGVAVATGQTTGVGPVVAAEGVKVGTGVEPVVAAEGVTVGTGVEPAVAAEGVSVGTGVGPVVAAEGVSAGTGVALAGQDVSIQSRGESRIVHSDGTRRFEVRYRGTIALADDDRSIASISPGGYLIVSDGRWFWLKDYRVEIRADRDGALESRFWVDGHEQPFEPEGREWLEKSLLRLVRSTGFAADARVARILKANGPAGVLDEIAQLEADYARRVYFETLFDQATLDGAMLTRALTLAGQTISSDYELSRSLRKAGETQRLDDNASQTAYVDAATRISSDYELQRTLAAVLTRAPLGDALVVRLLDAASHLSSDYEASRFLRALVERQPLSAESRAAFFRAVGTIGSDYEHQRVLAAVMARRGLTDAEVALVLQSALELGSDYERSRLLRAVAGSRSVDGPLAVDFFKAAGGIGSDYEKQRVLAIVAGKAGLSEETLVALLGAAKGIGSDYELSRLLVKVAETQTLEGRARDAFLDAADGIGSSHESGKVMTALVRNERRR